MKRVLLFFIVLAHMQGCFDGIVLGYWVRIRNTTNQWFDPGSIEVHNTLAGCSDTYNSYDIGPDEPYFEEYVGRCGGGVCFDWYSINGRKFYIPNQCHDVSIEIRPDGLFLNGSSAMQYGDVGAFFSFVGLEIAKGFEDLGQKLENVGEDIEKIGEQAIAFAKDLANRAQECVYMTKDSGELAGREIAYGVATAALETAKAAAQGTLTAGEQVAKGSIIATAGTIEGVSQTTQGVLTGAGEAAKGILTAVDIAIKEVLEAFDIEELSYEGQLSDMEHGKLGDVTCVVKILGQTENFNFDLDVRDPIHSVESVVQQIVNKLIDAVKSLVHI